MNFISTILLALALAGVTSQQAAKPLDISDSDDKRIAALHERGVRIDCKLGCFAFRRGHSATESAQLIGRLDKGVEALRQPVGTYPWQMARDQKITFA